MTSTLDTAYYRPVAGTAAAAGQWPRPPGICRGGVDATVVVAMIERGTRAGTRAGDEASSPDAIPGSGRWRRLGALIATAALAVAACSSAATPAPSASAPVAGASGPPASVAEVEPSGTDPSVAGVEPAESATVELPATAEPTPAEAVPLTPETLGCIETSDASIGEIETPYVCADSGLRPDPNGFSFENWDGLAPGEVVDAEMLVRLFGADEVCVDPGAATCEPKSAAIAWATQLQNEMKGGHCEGMAVASQLFYGDANALQEIDGSATATGDIEKSNQAAVEAIVYWWATQEMPEVAKVAAASRQLAPSRIVQDVTAGLRDKRMDTMGMYMTDGAHAVTPFAVTYDETAYTVWVYDSNNPGIPGQIIVDPETESWKYVPEPGGEVQWTGEGVDSLEYTPMAVRMLDFTAPFSDKVREDGFAYIVTATSPDGAGGVDVSIATGGTTVDSSTGPVSTDALLVDQITEDGSGYGTVAYARADADVAITPHVHDSGTLDISVDGPGLPWTSIHATGPKGTDGAGASPVVLTLSGGSSLTIAVAPGTVAEISVDTGEAEMREIRLTGPATLHVRVDPATSRIEITQE